MFPHLDSVVSQKVAAALVKMAKRGSSVQIVLLNVGSAYLLITLLC